MRKKSARSNQRKFHLLSLFPSSSRGNDETDWIMLEAELTKGSVEPAKKTRPQFTWLIRILGIACLSVSIPIGAKWIHNAVFYENEEFVLQRLNIHTDGMLSVGNLSEVTNVSVGMGLMELDLNRIRERIEKLPSVESAVVSREMPDKLNIMVTERVPIAWLSCPPLGIRPGDMERGFLVDGKGILFRCLDLTETVKTLPMIETFKMEEPKEGSELKVAGAGSALRLIGQSVEDLSDFEGMQVDAIRLRNEWSLQSRYRSGIEVTFSLFEIERGLEDLIVILRKTRDVGPELATVNVAAKENIPITFASPLSSGRISMIGKSAGSDAETPVLTPETDKEKHLRSILNGG